MSPARSTAESKVQLRRRLVAERSAVDPSALARDSAALCARLLALPELGGARCVAGYVAFRGEIDPAAALSALRARGAAIALPRVVGRERLVLHRHADGAALLPNRFGIPEPPADDGEVDALEVDAILVPAVAVDAAGRRLGLGRGYYDRLLPRLSRAIAIAVVHDFQLIARVPSEAHDARVPIVVTPARTLRTDAQAPDPG